MIDQGQATKAREAIVASGRSLFDRGLASGSSGNISVLLGDGTMLVTPTDIGLGQLTPERIALIGAGGERIDGDAPSKEAFLHRAIYAARPAARAIVHLHSSYSAAVSCMDGLSADACLPPLTAYFAMKVGRLPLIEYHRPGDPHLVPRIQELAPRHRALLLANHGPIVAGTSLPDALNAIEELEETAKLFLFLRGSATRPLDAEQIAELEAVFGPPGGA